MQWSDEGVILGTRRHGESSLIVELMTPGHGRHLGLVRGGRSRRQRPALQVGNSVAVTWRARLQDHLGAFSIELTTPRAARMMDNPLAIQTVQCLAALLRLLPERDPHATLYEGLVAVLDLPEPDELVIAAMLVRFEVRMLEELGFGLDLETCAGGGEGDLVYVSPRSGRAVSEGAGAPYRDRLLRLPAFVCAAPTLDPPQPADALDGLRLTGFFLARHVYEARGLSEPEARSRLASRLVRQVAAA